VLVPLQAARLAGAVTVVEVAAVVADAHVRPFVFYIYIKRLSGFFIQRLTVLIEILAIQ
jgi:hypothetical protein